MLWAALFGAVGVWIPASPGDAAGFGFIGRLAPAFAARARLPTALMGALEEAGILMVPTLQRH